MANATEDAALDESCCCNSSANARYTLESRKFKEKVRKHDHRSLPEVADACSRGLFVGVDAMVDIYIYLLCDNGDPNC